MVKTGTDMYWDWEKEQEKERKSKNKCKQIKISKIVKWVKQGKNYNVG